MRYQQNTNYASWVIDWVHHENTHPPTSLFEYAVRCDRLAATVERREKRLVKLITKPLTRRKRRDNVNPQITQNITKSAT